MEPLLTRYTKIKSDILAKPLNNFENLDPEKQQAIFDFVLNFRMTEYIELERIFCLPLDRGMTVEDGFELWDRYFKYGKIKFVEMKMFLKQARVCRDNWKKCPRYRVSINNQNNGNPNGKAESDETIDPEAPQGIPIQSEP